MVLNHEYGADCLQEFFKYELDRYLRGRAGEDKFEATLPYFQRMVYSYIKAATPDLLKYFIEDAFEKITLYEDPESRIQKNRGREIPGEHDGPNQKNIRLKKIDR